MKFVRSMAWLAVFLGTALTGSVAGEGGNSEEPPVNPDPQQLVWIKPGTFTMGSPSTEKERYSCEGPQTQVTISKGFWMSKYETTQEEYMAVMGTNPSYFKGEPRKPVEQVSWDDATNYCAKLTARKREAGTLPAGYAYRLPREAEWEYACRAGTTTAMAYGDGISSTQANFCGAPYGSGVKGPNLRATTKVGSYAPNAWGLYDMHGNVWECCLDWYSGSLPGGNMIDPRGPNTGAGRVHRGGSWIGSGWYCRSAFRFGRKPDIRNGYVGFRPVMAPVQ